MSVAILPIRGRTGGVDEGPCGRLRRVGGGRVCVEDPDGQPTAETIWTRLYGALGTPMFNFEVVR